MTFNFEQELSVLEEKTASAFKALMFRRTLRAIDDEDKAWIGVFLASQHIRVKNFREMILDADRQFCERLREMGVEPKNARGFSPLTPLRDEKQSREFATYFLFKNVRRFAAEMLNKKWVLFETTKHAPFCIGDNPVTLHNDKDFGAYGNIGLAVPGIQIHLPITRNLTLALWCSALFEGKRKEMQRLQAMALFGYHRLDAATRETIRLAAADFRRIEAGDAVMLNDDNVLFLNSLQARWADRCVMSRVKNFSMVERMLKDFPESRRGPRIRVG